MSRTIEQQIAEATNKLQRLKTRQRTKDTRRKIVVGATMLAEARENPAVAKMMLSALQSRVTREVDIKDIAPVIDELKSILEG